MPAGGTSILGAAVFIFVVLLITDILGFTDVFPFVNNTAR
ncbi:PA2779 family protein [Arhodomonas sp. KWT]|nr:PA2779 family protein [Arhodomonas sp. KWT]